ncbi:MAG: glycosyltransferase family 4 protein [Bacteroidia bacterium]
MKVLYVIPANVTKHTIHYSPFIKSELLAVKGAGVLYEIFYLTIRNSLTYLFYSRKLLKNHIQKFQPNLIHAQYGSVTSFLVMLCKPRMPWVVTFGGNDMLGHPYPGLRWRIREQIALWMSRTSATKATGIICVSKKIYERLPDGVKEKAMVLTRGVNISIFKPDGNEEKSNNKKITILFNQSKEAALEKNLPLAEKAVAALRELYPDVHQQTELVVVMGKPVETLVAMMNAADVLLVTSTQEGSPNIVKEAMACNLPVVSVDCGDVAERLQGVSPSAVVPHDAMALAQAIFRVVQAGGRSNGRSELIRQGLDAQTVAHRLLAFYRKIVAA